MNKELLAWLFKNVRGYTYIADVSLDVARSVLLEHVFQLVEFHMFGNVSDEQTHFNL